MVQDHKFVGEETTFSEGAEELGGEPTWVIDPLGAWISIHCQAASAIYGQDPLRVIQDFMPPYSLHPH